MKSLLRAIPVPPAVALIILSAGTIFPTAALALPDLLSTALTINPTSQYAGGTLTAQFTLQNPGDQPSGPFKVALYYSSDMTITLEDTLLTVLDVNELGAGATSAPMQAIVTIPASASPGTRYIGVILDSQQQVVESDELNNVRRANLSVLLTRPDFQVSSLEVNPSSILQKGKVSVSIWVTNAGNRDGGLFKTRLYLSDNSAITTEDTYLGVEHEQTLDAGTTGDSLTAEVTIPLSAEPGTRYIGAIADWDGTLQESDENNNTRAAPITIMALTCHGKSAASPDVCGSHGTCVSPDLCECADGWADFDCLRPLCTDMCDENGWCVAPDTCECFDGFTGDGFSCVAIEDVIVVEDEGTPVDTGAGYDSATSDEGGDDAVEFDEGTGIPDVLTADTSHGDAADIDEDVENHPGDSGTGIDTNLSDSQGRTDTNAEVTVIADVGAGDSGQDDNTPVSPGGGCNQSDGSNSPLILLLVAGLVMAFRRREEGRKT